MGPLCIQFDESHSEGISQGIVSDDLELSLQSIEPPCHLERVRSQRGVVFERLLDEFLELLESRRGLEGVSGGRKGSGRSNAPSTLSETPVTTEIRSSIEDAIRGGTGIAISQESHTASAGRTDGDCYSGEGIPGDRPNS
jgi:hypothetical protein